MPSFEEEGVVTVGKEDVDDSILASMLLIVSTLSDVLYYSRHSTMSSEKYLLLYRFERAF